MIRKNGYFRIFLIVFTFTTIMFSIWAASLTDGNDFHLYSKQESWFDDFEDEIDLKIASNGNPLDYEDFHQNATTVYRLFQSVKFDINASKFTNPNYTIMRFRYFNKIEEDFTMEHVPGTINFTYTYTPKYYDHTGFTKVSFLIYNITNDLLSSITPITNFTIKTNFLLSFTSLKREYNRNETLTAELIVTDEPPLYNFNWNITVVDSDNETVQNNLFDIGNNLDYISFVVDDRFNFTNDFYFIKINITETTRSITAAAYYSFTALNTLPEIVEASVEFSKSPLKRAEDCTLNLNVTDADPYTLPENITVSLIIQDSTGIIDDPIQLTNNDDWTYTTTFSIDITKPIGRYQMLIVAEDQYGGQDNLTKSLGIQNNPPEIEAYYVNGINMNQSVSVNYGRDLVFTFDLSDVENTIEYVTVSLLDVDNNWYNVTRKYKSNLRITIRTEELITGVWYVYISVTDADGATTHLHADYNLAPQEINIIPDLLTPVLPWITFSIGLLIGLLAGIGILYKKFRTTSAEAKETSAKKPSKAPKPTPSKKKVIKEDIEKPIEKDREETLQTPQRKIKRKLK
ncbi:MAG: hypothetical protein ACFE96_12545 [Candidatus Hermodarchaeota archaeon]